jgi:DHA2 family multidrug resistance protein
MLAVVMSPIVAKLIGRIDARALVTFGVLTLGALSLYRSQLASNANFWFIALPFLAQGFAIPFFFIPTNQIALSAVPPNETAAAAGLSNFLRTTAAAFATSIITTLWENAGNSNHAELAGRLNDTGGVINTFTSAGLNPDQALGQLDGILQGQSVMLATDQMFVITTLVFVVAGLAVWLGPKPKLGGGPMSGGH